MNARERELMQYAPFEFKDWLHMSHKSCLSRSEFEHLENLENQWFKDNCYTTAFVWRNV